jgi:mRNA interferase MazF
MATPLHRGEVWMFTFEAPDKRRPILLLSREAILPYLRQVNIAEITSSIRGLPTEVVLGIDDGMKHACCVNLHQVYTVERALLRTYVTTLSAERMRQVCKALGTAMGCTGVG